MWKVNFDTSIYQYSLVIRKDIPMVYTWMKLDLMYSAGDKLLNDIPDIIISSQNYAWLNNTKYWYYHYYRVPSHFSSVHKKVCIWFSCGLLSIPMISEIHTIYAYMHNMSKHVCLNSSNFPGNVLRNKYGVPCPSLCLLEPITLMYHDPS